MASKPSSSRNASIGEQTARINFKNRGANSCGILRVLRISVGKSAISNNKICRQNKLKRKKRYGKSTVVFANKSGISTVVSVQTSATIPTFENGLFRHPKFGFQLYVTENTIAIKSAIVEETFAAVHKKRQIVIPETAAISTFTVCVLMN